MFGSCALIFDVQNRVICGDCHWATELPCNVASGRLARRPENEQARLRSGVDRDLHQYIVVPSDMYPAPAVRINGGRATSHALFPLGHVFGNVPRVGHRPALPGVKGMLW